VRPWLLKVIVFFREHNAIGIGACVDRHTPALLCAFHVLLEHDPHPEGAVARKRSNVPTAATLEPLNVAHKVGLSSRSAGTSQCANTGMRYTTSRNLSPGTA
jgi:hypothetical protein